MGPAGGGDGGCFLGGGLRVMVALLAEAVGASLALNESEASPHRDVIGWPGAWHASLLVLPLTRVTTAQK